MWPNPKHTPHNLGNAADARAKPHYLQMFSHLKPPPQDFKVFLWQPQTWKSGGFVVADIGGHF